MRRRLILSVVMLTVAVTLNGAFMSGIRNTGANLSRLVTNSASRAGGQMPAMLNRGAAGQRMMPGIARRFYSGYTGSAQQGAQFGGRYAALLGGAGAAGLGYGLYQNRDRLEEAGLLPQGWRNAMAFACEPAERVELENDGKPLFNSEEESILSMGSFVKIVEHDDDDNYSRLLNRIRNNPLFAQHLVQLALKDFDASLRSTMGERILEIIAESNQPIAEQLAEGIVRNYPSIESIKNLWQKTNGRLLLIKLMPTQPELANKFADLAFDELSRASHFSFPIDETIVPAALKANPSLATQFAELAVERYTRLVSSKEGSHMIDSILQANPSLRSRFDAKARSIGYATPSEYSLRYFMWKA